jgi:hypothetical protein
MPVKLENVGLGHVPYRRQEPSTFPSSYFTMDNSTRTAPPIDDDVKFEKGDVEYVEEASHLDANLDVQDTIKGTVGLTGEGGAVVLIPTPSADPSGESGAPAARSLPFAEQEPYVARARQIPSIWYGGENGHSSLSYPHVSDQSSPKLTRL